MNYEVFGPKRSFARRVEGRGKRLIRAPGARNRRWGRGHPQRSGAPKKLERPDLGSFRPSEALNGPQDRQKSTHDDDDDHDDLLPSLPRLLLPRTCYLLPPPLPALVALGNLRVGIDVVYWLRSIQSLKDAFADAPLMAYHPGSSALWTGSWIGLRSVASRLSLCFKAFRWVPRRLRPRLEWTSRWTWRGPIYSLLPSLPRRLLPRAC